MRRCYLVALCLLGFAGGALGLALALVLAGIGNSPQHPLNSTLVARAYQDGPVRTALGIYNFSGDLGKMAVPGLAALALASLDWRYVTYSYGGFGIIAAIGLLFLLRLFLLLLYIHYKQQLQQQLIFL